MYRPQHKHKKHNGKFPMDKNRGMFQNKGFVLKPTEKPYFRIGDEVLFAFNNYCGRGGIVTGHIYNKYNELKYVVEMEAKSYNSKLEYYGYQLRMKSLTRKVLVEKYNELIRMKIIQSYPIWSGVTVSNYAILETKITS
jgi:hypothetical protein